MNKRSRRVFAIVEQRQRVADSLARQLQALGLERRERAAMSLAEYVSEKYGGEPEQNSEVDDRHNAQDRHTPDVMDGQEGSNGALR